MSLDHHYHVNIKWTGAAQGPAQTYTSYSREYEILMEGKKTITGSADPSYRGDASLPNPEDLLVASISACHMLTYIALCVRSKFDVVSYEDAACGIMQMSNEKMRVTDVVLKPKVVLGPGADLAKAQDLHREAHDQCFITNSVLVDVTAQPEITVLS